MLSPKPATDQRPIVRNSDTLLSINRPREFNHARSGMTLAYVILKYAVIIANLVSVSGFNNNNDLHYNARHG